MSRKNGKSRHWRAFAALLALAMLLAVPAAAFAMDIDIGTIGTNVSSPDQYNTITGNGAGFTVEFTYLGTVVLVVDGAVETGGITVPNGNLTITGNQADGSDRLHTVDYGPYGAINVGGGAGVLTIDGGVTVDAEGDVGVKAAEIHVDNGALHARGSNVASGATQGVDRFYLGGRPIFPDSRANDFVFDMEFYPSAQDSNAGIRLILKIATTLAAKTDWGKAVAAGVPEDTVNAASRLFETLSAELDAFFTSANLPAACEDLRAMYAAQAADIPGLFSAFVRKYVSGYVSAAKLEAAYSGALAAASGTPSGLDIDVFAAKFLELFGGM